MYAIVRLGSHQYMVSPGKTISVEKIDGSIGSEVRMKDVLMVANGDKVKLPPQVKGHVIGHIKAQTKGDKIYSFKRLRRKGFHKTIGHRQPYTLIEISKIEA
jgi:large subunit ribosomal protein L21